MDIQKRERFGDIWFRARHNALANEVASVHYKLRLNIIDFILATLIVAPLVSSLLVKENLLCNKTGIIVSIAGTFGALLLSLVGIFRDWRESYNNHRRAHAVFNNIAQRARRGENELDQQEVGYLLRSLEEMFETAKFNFSEPTDKHYNLGLQRMTNMPRWPFGLDKEKYKSSSRGFWSFLNFSRIKSSQMSKDNIATQNRELFLAKAKFYDSLNFEDIHQTWCKDFVFTDKAILDVGCGSGRDSVYMASKGAKVTAIDKSEVAIDFCRKKAVEDIAWLNDSLPKIQKVRKLKETYDLILVSAVLMFLNKPEQLESIKTLLGLLKSPGTLIITFKKSKTDKEIYDFNEEIYDLVNSQGCSISTLDGGVDSANRDVEWIVYKVIK